MPTFNIGQLSSGVYYDGTPVRPNQSVVPVLLVVDSNGKTASLKGDPITIVDVVPPLVTGTLSQTQGATDYKITPSGLTISDDANGVLKVYHILATSLLTDATLTSIIGNVSFVALVDYGFNQNLSYVAGTSPSIVTSDITGLRVSKVYTGSSFREITHGDSIVSHVLAVDPNGLKTLKTTAARRVTDYTAPTLSGFTLGTVAGGSVSVSWNAVLDAGDDAITPATATNVYVGVYTANNNTLFTATPSKIVEGGSATGITGFVRLISISNEATTTLNIGNGGDGGAALVNGTNYFIYAVARDAASNYSTVSSVTSTTLDTTDPLITSFAVSQNSTTYEFSATAGTVSDNVSGNLRMYLIMSSTTLATDAEFLAAINSTTNGGLETTAKNETITYASGNSVNVITAASGSTTFKTTKFWNKSTSTYAAITETAPGTPYKLRGYLVVRDAANNIGFGETVETDVVDKNAPNLSSFTAGTPLVDKVPLSWTVTEGRSYKMYIVAFETPQTMSATEVYTGTKAGQLSRATITTSSPYSFGTSTNGESALSGSKTYYFYAVAREDVVGNMSSVLSVGPVNTVDVTAPVIGATAFGVTQGTSDYIFTASGSYKDNRTGTLTAHLVLSPSTHTTDQLKTILANSSTATPRLASATKTSAGIAANTDVLLSGNDLKTNQYWNGTNNWVTITETAPASPYTLNAYLVVYDGATTPNVSSFNVSVSIADKNAPTFSGSLTLALEGTTGIKVTWDTGFADGRGITDAKVYYGTTAPTSTSVADLNTWKSATTTSNQTVTTAAIAAAGNLPVTGLTAGTTYYAYVCVKDAANNELNVVTSPASVAIAASAPSGPYIQTYANRYVELPDFETFTSGTISSVYGTSDTAAMQNIFTNSPNKTLIVWFDKPGRDANENNYGGYSNATQSIMLQQTANYNFRVLNNAGGTFAFQVTPGIKTENNDFLNEFIAITKSADGTIKAYSNITGDANSGPLLDVGITKNIGAFIQQSVFSIATVPSTLLDFTNFGNAYFGQKTSVHWKDLMVFPEALSLSQIQSLYDRPRHVVDLHGTNMSRLGNVVSKSANSETRVGIPVYMHGKAYFEFDADNMSTTSNGNTWGLAETTKLVPQNSGYLGTEVSGTRALSVAHGAHVNSTLLAFKNVQYTNRPVLTTDSTTVRRTYCLAVDYTTGHAWWGIDGYFGGYNPVTRAAVSGRTAQLDPALDSTTPNTTTPDVDVRRMRYAVIRNFNGVLRLYLKSAYQYTPSGFTPFYTYASSQLYSPFSGGFPNTHQGVMDFFRANSSGFATYGTTGAYAWDAVKQMYFSGAENGNAFQIYSVEHLRPPFRVSMEFECSQTSFLAQVGAFGNPVGDLNAVNSFSNQTNLVSHRSTNSSTGTMRGLHSNGTKIQDVDVFYTGPTIPLNVKCMMTVTVFSSTSVEIRVERADGTAITNGVYTNTAVSPAFASTLDWRAYFQIQSPGVYFGNLKFESNIVTVEPALQFARASTAANVLAANTGMIFYETPTFPAGDLYMRFTASGNDEGFRLTGTRVGPTTSLTFMMHVEPTIQNGSVNFQGDIFHSPDGTQSLLRTEAVYIGGTSSSHSFGLQGGFTSASSVVTHSPQAGTKYKIYLTVDVLASTASYSVYDATTRAVIVNNQQFTSPLPTTSRFFSIGMKRFFNMYDYKVYVPALTASQIQNHI